MDVSDVPGAPRVSYLCRESDEGLDVRICRTRISPVNWSCRKDLDG